MMSEDSGGRVNVAGSNIAIVATGPMPGNTPIKVPSRQPIKQYKRLLRVRATPKPRVRFAIS